MISNYNKLKIFKNNIIRKTYIYFKSITHYIILINSKLQNYLRLKINKIFFNYNIHNKYIHYTLINHSSHKNPFLII